MPGDEGRVYRLPVAVRAHAPRPLGQAHGHRWLRDRPGLRLSRYERISQDRREASVVGCLQKARPDPHQAFVAEPTVEHGREPAGPESHNYSADVLSDPPQTG